MSRERITFSALLAARAAKAIAPLLLAAALVAAPSAAVDEGMPAPPFAVADGEGTIVEFPAHADGAPAVVLFWATWCPYCRVVMPELQVVAEDYADQGVRVYALGINERNSGVDPVARAEELGFDFIVLPGAEAVAESWDVPGTPGIFVVDGAGQVIYRRKSTDEPPQQPIAELWAGQVRDALDAALAAQ